MTHIFTQISSKISFIIPTLGDREFELERILKSLANQLIPKEVNIEVIVVNQGNDIKFIIDNFSDSNITISYHKVDFKGLSKARNYAFQFCTGEIIILADDDCWYPPEAVFKIIEAHKNYSHELITFNIYDKLNNIPYKKYKKRASNHSWITIYSISSIEITFKRSILEFGVSFCEEFGMGTNHPSGEELIFCNELRKKGIKLKYIPHIIVYHEKKKDINNLKLGGGELFFELFHYNSIWIYLLFIFKKLINKQINFSQALFMYNKLIKILAHRISK
jgi:glycosyltransferase involved in cell wall biosynthesis